ncbi:hypothetical protein HGRIS_006606 [Hohenbuehelia grisea]|uniref:SET domain-containing protein n=1 Tax=Hohenbuehelia grisea TaxID=104357 RepID=A0ABR3J9I7_9AGAR
MRRGFLNGGQTKQRCLADPGAPPDSAGATVKKSVSSGTGSTNSKPIHVPHDTQHDDNSFLVTTQPSQMQGTSLAEVPGGWTECILTGKAKRMLLATPGFPQPVPSPTHPNCYRIANSPGKGLGVFANRDIRTGDLIIAERPITIAPAFGSVSLQGNSNDPAVREAHQKMEGRLEAVFARVPPENQQAYLALANCHLHDGSGKLTGIQRTNGFEVKGLGEGPYSGVFKDISRINHSCSPNTIRHWDPASLSLRLRAVRDIAKDEEITVHYVTIITMAQERAKELAPYQIKCSCPACANSLVSDTNRVDILLKQYINGPEMDKAFKQWCPDRDAPDDRVLNVALRELALLDSEGLQLHPGYGTLLSLALRCYIALGDEDKVLEFGQRAGRSFMAEKDGDRSLLDNHSSLDLVKKNKLWGIRRRMSKQA